MPKDATKNIDRYKVRGGELNEFDFHQNQQEFAERRTQATSLIPGTPPEAKAERLKSLTKKAASKKAAKATTTKKASKATKSVSARGASAEKRAANKAGKRTAKKATKKTAKKAAKKK